jgi:hypothetical protein
MEPHAGDHTGGRLLHLFQGYLTDVTRAFEGTRGRRRRRIGRVHPNLLRSLNRALHCRSGRRGDVASYAGCRFDEASGRH